MMITARMYFLAIVATIFIVAGCATTNPSASKNVVAPTALPVQVMKSTTPPTADTTGSWTYEEMFDGAAELTSQNMCVNVVWNSGTGKYRIKCASKKALQNFMKDFSREDVEKMKNAAKNSPEFSFGNDKIGARKCDEIRYR
jgi:hypothetical protein